MPKRTRPKETQKLEYVEWENQNPANSLKIAEQDNRLDFYQEGRTEPKPPPSEIISAVKHVPAVKPPKGSAIAKDIVPAGPPVKSEATKPNDWWTTPLPKVEDRAIRAPTHTLIIEPPPSVKVSSTVENSAGGQEHFEKLTEKSSEIENTEPQKDLVEEVVDFANIKGIHVDIAAPEPEKSSNKALVMGKPENSEDQVTPAYPEEMVKHVENPVIKEKIIYAAEESVGVKKESVNNLAEKSYETENEESNDNKFLVGATDDKVDNKEIDFDVAEYDKSPLGFLVVCETKDVKITNVKNWFDFYVVSVDGSDQKKLKSLETEMYDIYKNNGHAIEYTTLAWLGFYAWLKKDSSECFRVQIIARASSSSSDVERVKVHLIDHGHDVDDVDIQDLFPLLKQFLSPRRMSMPAKTHIRQLTDYGSNESEVEQNMTDEMVSVMKDFEGLVLTVVAVSMFRRMLNVDDLSYSETGAAVVFSEQGHAYINGMP